MCKKKNKQKRLEKQLYKKCKYECNFLTSRLKITLDRLTYH